MSRIEDFGHRPHRPRWIGEVEQELFRVRDIPDHLIFHIDDILVAGQHQPGIGSDDIARPLAAGIDLIGSQIGDAFAGDLHDFLGHHRPGGEVQTRLAGADGTAEQELDRAFLGPDGIETGQGPGADGDQTANDQCPAVKTEATAACAARTARTPPARAAAPAHEHAQPVLTLAHQILDLGHLALRTLAGTARRFGALPALIATLTPGALTAARRLIAALVAVIAAVSTAAATPGALCHRIASSCFVFRHCA